MDHKTVHVDQNFISNRQLWITGYIQMSLALIPGHSDLHTSHIVTSTSSFCHLHSTSNEKWRSE